MRTRLPFPLPVLPSVQAGGPLTIHVARDPRMRQPYCSYINDKQNLQMRGLNPDQLRTLVEVVEHGGFSAAARKLHLSQPAVSLQIRELESRLGVKLVDRVGKRAFASPAGAELIEHAK